MCRFAQVPSMHMPANTSDILYVSETGHWSNWKTSNVVFVLQLGGYSHFLYTVQTAPTQLWEFGFKKHWIFL